MKKAVLILGLIILFENAEIFCQEESFTDQSGLMFSVQFMALLDAPRISPVVGYKSGRLIYFAGYENIKYSSWCSNRQGLKAGVYIYPHKNLDKVKVYYQSLVSYKWHRPDEYTKMYFIHAGGGVDYFFSKNLSVGYDLNLGLGEMKDGQDSAFAFATDWNSSVTLKLWLIR